MSVDDPDVDDSDADDDDDSSKKAGDDFDGTGGEATPEVVMKHVVAAKKRAEASKHHVNEGIRALKAPAHYIYVRCAHLLLSKCVLIVLIETAAL